MSARSDVTQLGPLAVHRLATRMPELPPPPVEPPMADSAPDALVAFIYYMTRDLIPPRYTEGVLAHIAAHPDHKGQSDLWAYAEKTARRLLAGT
jgi:hypothetical protein